MPWRQPKKKKKRYFNEKLVLSVNLVTQKPEKIYLTHLKANIRPGPVSPQKKKNRAVEEMKGDME